jgi:bifunctional DNA-binding transcriptional regulator/antitoxin component of YhaV-PrlF toxin-antitoxin module
MKRRLKITSGGQVSLPAEIRRRWATRSVSIEDRGDEIVLRPFPDDPVRAVRGIFAGRLDAPLEEVRRREREAEAEAEDRKWSSLTRTR